MPQRTQSVSAVLAPLENIPPPEFVAELASNKQFVSVGLPPEYIPPPEFVAELDSNEQFVSVGLEL